MTDSWERSKSVSLCFTHFVDLSRNDAICFQLSELERDHVLGSVGRESSEFSKAPSALEDNCSIVDNW